MAKVLVIDDSSFQRKWIVRAVLAMGHLAVEASNGKEGLEKLQCEQPHCITIDLNMPEMNGLEFLAEMNNRKLSIPTIVITADIQEATRKECLELGAAAFLNKPFKPDQLQAAVEKCFEDEKGAQ